MLRSTAELLNARLHGAIQCRARRLSVVGALEEVRVLVLVLEEVRVRVLVRVARLCDAPAG